MGREPTPSPEPASARSERLRARASAAIVAGDSAAAAGHAEAAVAAAQAAGDHDAAGWAATVLSAARSNTGDRAGALAAVELGGAAFAVTGNEAGRGAILVLRALELLDAGDVGAAVDAYARASDHLGESTDARVEVVNALVELASTAAAFGDLAGGRVLAARAVALAELSDDPFAATYAAGALPALLVLVATRLELAEPDRSRALLAESVPHARAAIELATARGDVLQAAASRVGLAYALARRGATVQDVEALVAEAAVTGRAVELLATLAIAQVRAAAGDATGGLDALARFEELARGDEPPVLPVALSLRSELLEQLGDAPSALVAARAAATVAARREQATTAALAAIAEARLRAARAERQAREDPLTGLRNRRHIDERLALQEAGQGAVAIVDVDRFKDVNDRFGHGVGDAVLRRIAELLRAACARDDTVARLAGDELAVVFARDDAAEAGATCERVRRAVAGAAWAAIAPGLAVTVSIGVAAARPGEDGVAVLAAADASLYRAKRAGRDCVCARVDAAA